MSDEITAQKANVLFLVESFCVYDRLLDQKLSTRLLPINRLYDHIAVKITQAPAKADLAQISTLQQDIFIVNTDDKIHNVEIF